MTHSFLDGSSINNFNLIVLRSLLETKIVFKDQIFDLFNVVDENFIEEINTKNKNNFRHTVIK